MMSNFYCLILESSESSSSESEEEEEEEEEEVVVGREEVVVEWTPSGAQRALGDWEKHTTVSPDLM